MLAGMCVRWGRMHRRGSSVSMRGQGDNVGGHVVT